MNTVYIHQNEHCEIRIYQYSVAVNTTLYIYVANSATDYTFKSVSITINNGTPIVIENDGSYAVTDVPEIAWKIPFNVTVDNAFIEINTDVYKNPVITHIDYSNNYSIATHQFKNTTPAIYSKTGFNSITMYNGWKFFKYEIFDEENPETPYITKYVYNGRELTITPDMAGKEFFILISNDTNSVPVVFDCRGYDESVRAYKAIYSDIMYKSQSDIGTYFDYTPIEIPGYQCETDIVRNVGVFEYGNLLPVYYRPVLYSITAMYGTVTTESNDGLAKYTENVTITFDVSKYDGNPNDEVLYWETSDGYPIQNNKGPSITFKMPNKDLIVYPVIKPYRSNSSIYRNTEPEELIDGDFLFNAFNENLRSEDDVKQNNHGFIPGDVIYKDTNGKYKKAIADGTEKSLAIGIVNHVNSINTFGIQWAGPLKMNFDWQHPESSIMYLSDTEPGKLKFYGDIQNRVYVPIAVYMHDHIIVSMHGGTVGMEYIYYPDNIPEEHGAGPAIERYTDYEKSSLINDAIALFT